MEYSNESLAGQRLTARDKFSLFYVQKMLCCGITLKVTNILARVFLFFIEIGIEDEQIKCFEYVGN